MRPVQILDKPVAPPFVCIGCGAGVEREHFVDIGIDSKLEKIDEYNHTYYTEGVLYLCSRCMSSLVVEYMRKLPDFINHQFIARGFLLDSNKDEVRMLQDEVQMLRNRLNAVDDENQQLRYALQSKLELENGVISPPEPTIPTAEDVVDELLGTDTDGTSTGTVDSTADGRDSDAEGNNNDAERDNSIGEPDSLEITHLALGSFGNSDSPSS